MSDLDYLHAMGFSARIAWAAGLFEGEGCIQMHRSKQGYFDRRLTLLSTDRDVVTTFRQVVGCGVIRPRAAYANRKASWRWEASRWRDIEPLLRSLLPYLGKRRAAKARELLANPASKQGQLCKRGHPLKGLGADVYQYGRKGPQCAICAREQMRTLRARRAAAA